MLLTNKNVYRENQRRLTPFEEITLRERINADIKQQREEAEYLKNNFQMINSLIFPNDDLFYNELTGLNYL